MDKKLLKDSVSVLKQIRTELHGNVENNALLQLDKVIQDLETVRQGKSERAITALELLVLLGTLVEKAPQFAQVLEHLTRLIKNIPNH